ncbi:MAG: hypothetical protein LBB48_07335 [Treponema sp.]|nr:hypothetical protein [Treponema sp.]
MPEQKNNAFVKNYAAYRRYDIREELDALNRLCQFLCPLANFFIPMEKFPRTPGFTPQRDGELNPEWIKF